MGGHAFAHLSPSLPTPRMPREIYSKALTITHTLLRQHYRLVGSPIEAPGKDTFGDIDILVLDPNPNSPLHGVTFHSQLATKLSFLLGAKHYILENGNPTMNFAIPWPAEDGREKKGVIEERYIQLDVKVCDSEKMFEWELFHAAHGDLWNILGSTIRRFGLTVNNLGMYIRIPEIESFDRKKSMVFLTDNHRRIIEFLGLDPEIWWKEFGSREEMFEFAAGCRMFWVKDIEDDMDEAAGVMGGQESGELGKKKLKHNDRARLAKRPIFREWMDEFIPRCRVEGRFVDSKGVTREQIRAESFAHFGLGVGAEYETRLKEWMLAKHKDDMWRGVIKGNVPEDLDPQFRAASIRTLKGVIMNGETFKGKLVPEVAPSEEGFWDVEKVRVFVVASWVEAGQIGWARQQERAIEGMNAKAEKKRLQAEESERKRPKTSAAGVT